MTTESHLSAMKSWMEHMRSSLPPEARAIIDTQITLAQLDTGKICKPAAAQRFRILARTYNSDAPVLSNYLSATAKELEPETGEKKQCPITSSTFPSGQPSL